MLSRGADFNFVIGQRNAGKTYAAKEKALINNIQDGDEFCYVRRNEEEVAAVKNTLFDDIAHKFNVQVKVNGFRYMIRDAPPEDIEDYDKWSRETPYRPFGYIIALSDQQAFKSASFPRIKTIIFDEFIIENLRKRYIPNEPDMLISLAFTIARDRKIRVICLSNAGYLSNPYFQYYGVSAKDFNNSEFVKRKNGAVLFQYYHNANIEKKLQEGLIGRVSNDSYADYAISSKFMDFSTDNVLKEPKVLNEMLGIDGKYSICEIKEGFFVKRSKNPTLTQYTLDKHSQESRFIFSPELFRKLSKLNNRRELFFCDSDARAYFITTLK